MLSNLSYTRPHGEDLLRRLGEPRRFIQVITGARQVGKTTLITQVAEKTGLPYRYASADEPTLRGSEWIAQQWDAARLLERDAGDDGALLILDEVQKAPNWSEAVKRLWDEDTRSRRRLKVVLSGSTQLLIGRGLTESLAGRFELLHVPHWSFLEMRTAFGWSLEQFLFYGAYPGAAPLMGEPARWSRYIRDSLIETTIARDVLLLSRVDKPALLRRLFELGCAYSGQILSYSKMLGQLHDAGNTTTLAHYLDLLGVAGMLGGLQKYAGAAVRRRSSSPKFQVYNTALMTAGSGLTFAQARTDREFWGRLVESAVGAHLVNSAAGGSCEVFYWRDRHREVDFVVRAGRSVMAVEVKSGRTGRNPAGMTDFADAFHPIRSLLIGGDGIAVEEFLSKPVEHWINA
ncbi:MAG: ATP-binding protein [Gemmatimonadota bacterium]|nr:ATP-binding protein [Gemmatimonadota bacterium]